MLILVLCCAVSLAPAFTFKYFFADYMDNPQTTNPEE
jgi:hypothetical protein